MNPIRPLLAGTALALLSACADRQPVATLPAQNPDADPSLAAFECHAKVREHTVTCGRPGSLAGARADFLGGQGVYVRLASSNAAYDAGTQIFSVDVTVQNLLDQAIGTPDGVTVDSLGVRVFFHLGPAVTAGSGAVTVANPDGTGTFTAAGQPYFRYVGVLAPDATSPAKDWRFNVPPSATAFAFLVYLDVRVQPRLVINEIMAHPATASEPAGEWFEIYNAGVGRVDLNGFTIASGGDAGHTITGSLVVPTGGYVVMGGSTDSTANGGARVNYAYSGIDLGNDATDWLALRSPTGVAIDSMSWGAAPGDTPAPPPTGRTRALLSPDSVNTYLSGAHSPFVDEADIYGAGQRGSPARRNLRPLHAVAVGVGTFHSCIADTAGQAWCWGAGPLQLGNTARFGDTTLAVPVTQPAGTKFGRLAAASNLTCAVSYQGEIWCWGFHPDRRLGDRAEKMSEQEGRLFTSVGTAFNSVCALDASNVGQCWGVSVGLPRGVAELEFPGPISQIAVGFDHDCVLSAGRVYCAGSNTWGQLGDSTRYITPYFTAVKLPAGLTIQAVAAGVSATCALDTAGKAYCWGANESGQAGNNRSDTGGEIAPVAVQQPAGVTFVSLSVGSAMACGLTAGGQAYCWGSNLTGQLGDGTLTQRRVPTPVAQRGVLFSMIAAGGSHTCAIEVGSGQPFCWGNNPYGQLGIGTVTPSRLPVAAGR